MKGIIRQAVADAAEYLFVSGSSDECNLMILTSEALLRTAKKARAELEDSSRRDQLADFVADPVRSVATTIATEQPIAEGVSGRMAPGSLRIDNVLITGPGGFVAHGAGVSDRTVMIDHRPMVTVRDDKGALSQQPATDWQIRHMSRRKRRVEVANAAWFLFDQGYAYALDSVQGLLMSLSPDALIRDAAAFGCGAEVTVPRALLERLEKKLTEALSPMTCGCLDELRKLL